MAARLPDYNESINFPGNATSSLPDRRMLQELTVNSLIKIDKSDFSSLLLRHLPEPVSAPRLAGKGSDFGPVSEKPQYRPEHRQPQSQVAEARVSSDSGSNPRQRVESAQERQSGDSLPVGARQDEQTPTAPDPAGDHIPAEEPSAKAESAGDQNDLAVAEGHHHRGENATLSDLANLPARSGAGLTDNEAAGSEALPEDGALTTEEAAQQHSGVAAQVLTPGVDGAGPALSASAAEALAKPAPGITTDRAAAGLVLPVTPAGAGEQLSDEESLAGIQRVLSAQLNGSGSEPVKAEDPQVTQQFKELNGNIAGLQSATFAKTIVKEPSLLEQSATQRLSSAMVEVRDKPGLVLTTANALRPMATVNTPSSPYVTNIPAQVQTPEWQQGVVKKLTWFVSEKIQSAKIHLNPPELGPVDVKIQVNRDQAQVQIQSPHAVVRDLLEGTAIRLRELLANQGMDLTGFNVGTQEEQSGQKESSHQHAQPADQGVGVTLDSETGVSILNQGPDQIVDYYV